MSDIPDFKNFAESEPLRNNSGDTGSDLGVNSSSSPNGSRPKKKALIVALAACAFAAIAFCGYFFLYHNWSPATCTTPEKCAICGKTRGEALEHDWEEASCTNPMTCSRCGETEGEALGHEWEDATCTEPKTCSRCGETQGSELGHKTADWVTDAEPTCTKKGKRHSVCSRCKQEISESIPKLDHTPGEWQIVEDISLSMYGQIQPGIEKQYCTACGEELGSREYTITVSNSQANANRQAMQELRSLHLSHDGLIRQLYEYEGFTEEEAIFAADHCNVDWNEQAVKNAKEKLRYQGYSRSGLIEALTTFELFTNEQAEYAADQVGL